MGIETIIAMVPKGGKYAKSVVNFVHKAPENWSKFTEAVKQITDLLKQGKLRLDGKQKTIFESNKNILKNHEKVTKEYNAEVDKAAADALEQVFKDPKDYFKGWTPSVITGGQGRNVPPTRLYTAEMERIDNELDELVFGNKYNMFSEADKTALFKQLHTNMKKLIDKAMKDDLATLSLSEINKKSHALQKRIREIADNPNIQGDVHKGPKRDMIKVLYDNENPALRKARDVINRKNVELKYGKTFPRLDPENDAFIILGLDSSGNPIKVSRFSGRFSATKDTKGDLTRKEGTSYYDTWDPKKNQMRKEGEEVWHETVDAEGKTIMSNPEYKLPKTQNLDMNTEFYTDLSTSDLAKKGFSLKQIDMIRKGREVRKYLEKTENPDVNIRMHEQTSTNEIRAVMEDLYHRGDDVYKMSIAEWTKKIPEYFSEGGRTGFHRGSLRHQKEHDYQSLEDEGNFMRYLALSGDRAKAYGMSPEGGIFGSSWLATDPDKRMDYSQERDDFETMMKERFMYGEHIPPNVFKQMVLDFKEMYKKLKGSKKRNEHATGGVSNLFRERQGYRDPGRVIKLAKGARWLIKQLKSVLDDMIYGSGDVKSIFSKMPEAQKVKIFKQTESAIKSLEAGGPIPDEILTNLRNDARFKGLTVSTKADKDFIEMQEVVVGKTTQGAGEKIIEGTVVDETVDLMAFKKELPADIIANLNKLPVEDQTVLLTRMKKAFDTAKKGGIESGAEVLQEQLLTDFIPKGKPHATGGLIDGYATGGVSNLFRQRQGFRTGYRVGKIVEAAPKLAQGAAWVIKQLEALIKEARNLGVWSRFSKMGTKDRSEAITSAKEQILNLKSGDPVPESLLDDILTNPKFKLKRSKATDPDLVEVENLAEGYNRLKNARANKFRGEIKLSPNDPSGAYSRNASSALDDYNLFTPVTKDMYGKPWKGKKNWIKEERAKIKKTQEEIGPAPSSRHPEYRSMVQIRKGLEDRITALDITEELGGNIKMFDKLRMHNYPTYKNTLDKRDWLMPPGGLKRREAFVIDLGHETLPPIKKAEGGLIPGYATGGVSNLFRSR